MCCFSGPVKEVSSTRIFARESEKEKQYLVYSMQVETDKDVAMILPIPTPKKSPEDAVRFISLEEYHRFFDDLEDGFPKPPTAAVDDAPRIATAKGEAPPPLKVVEVGSFDASFVPTIKDFDRLDERFRLPAGTWDALPQYQDFGFAVFKLKPGKLNVHPMAFEFPRAFPSRLFFPTVHIHDGKVHKTADFDHELYCQIKAGDDRKLFRWVETPGLAESFVKVEKTKGIIDGKLHCHKKAYYGKLTNTDVLI